MCIHEVTVFGVYLIYSRLCFVIGAITADKVLAYDGLHCIGDLITPGACEFGHIACHLSIAAAHGIEQALKVAGYENIHRRGNRGIECPVAIVHTAREEISQNVILV